MSAPAEVPITRAQAAVLVDIGRMAAEACGLAYGPSGDEVAELRAALAGVVDTVTCLCEGLAQFFDDLSEIEGVWSDEVHDHVIRRAAIETLADKYADRIEASCAVLSQHQKGDGHGE